jgi:hypothetical protein
VTRDPEKNVTNKGNEMPIKFDTVKQYQIPVLKAQVFLPPKKSTNHSGDACAEGYAEYLESLKFSIKNFNSIKIKFNNFLDNTTHAFLFETLRKLIGHLDGKVIHISILLGYNLAALSWSILKNPVNQALKSQIEDYLSGLQNIMLNCHNELTDAQKLDIKHRINDVKDKLEFSYATYLKQQKQQANKKAKKPNILPPQTKPSPINLMTELQKLQETDRIMASQSRDIFIKKWIPKDLINWGQLPATAVGAPMPTARPVRVR